MASSISLVSFVPILLLLSISTRSTLCNELVSLTSSSPTHWEDINQSEDELHQALVSEIFAIILNKSTNNPKVRPPGVNGTIPTAVKVSLFIRSIENIDDVKMEYTVQLSFRQEWIDPRLRYSHMNRGDLKYVQLLGGIAQQQIWMPDIFFSNEKKSTFHDLMRPNRFTRIFPDGGVLQSYRVTLLLACPMNLRSYPLDHIRCPIRMASYGWTTQNILVQWKGDKETSIDMAQNFPEMPRFQLRDYDIDSCSSTTGTGNYSCIETTFLFVREFEFYLVQIYIPCSMLSIVSWVTFWMEPTAVEARVSLGVTTVLAVLTQTYGINQSAPPASYVKAMDIWTAFCQAMVFGSLLEFAFVNYIAKLRVPSGNDGGSLLELSPKDASHGEREQRKAEANNQQLLTIQALHKAKSVDTKARVLFPLTFIIFNVFYWPYYLS